MSNSNGPVADISGTHQNVVGGYRLVRVLGEGSRATVHLGFADGATLQQQPRTAAIKIHREGVALDAIDREIAALTRVRHPHLVSLVDLATLPTRRPCLVFERLGAGGLAQLVAERSELGPGEAVTVLAPVVLAVDALHRGGVVHGRVRATNVVFREGGAPVLVGFGNATLIVPGESPAALAQNDLVLADRRALVRLVTSVLELVPGESARELAAAFESDGVSTDDFGSRLAERLFDLATPEPVRMARAEGRPFSPSAAPRRVLVGAALEPGGGGVQHPGLEPDATRVSARVRFATNHLRGLARDVRPRIWIAAAIVAVSLVVALVLVPRSDGDATVAGDRGSATTTPAADTGDEPVAADDPVGGDDPVAALIALLDERSRCFRDVSVLCLDGVLQAGSAAMERDSALIRRVQDGGESTMDAAIVASAPVLVERLGDSALVMFGDVPQTQPASTLVMRGEAGWRIRDYVGE